MICKNCGSENEEGVSVCLKCGAELAVENDDKKQTPMVKTYIVGNIFYIIISLPFFWFTVLSCKSLQPYYFNAPFPLPFSMPFLVFVTVGVIVAFRFAGRVKATARGGDYERARKMARRSASLFAIFFALNLVLGPYLFVGVASDFVYQQKSYESAAMSELKRLGALQNGVYEKKGSFAEQLDELDDWVNQKIDDVEVKIISVEGKCWKGSARHKEGEKTVFYDLCSSEDDYDRFTKKLL